MGNRVRRRNEELLHWLRSAAIAAATYGGLAGMGFQPGWAAVTGWRSWPESQRPGRSTSA